MGLGGMARCCAVGATCDGRTLARTRKILKGTQRPFGNWNAWCGGYHCVAGGKVESLCALFCLCGVCPGADGVPLFIHLAGGCEVAIRRCLAETCRALQTRNQPVCDTWRSRDRRPWASCDVAGSSFCSHFAYGLDSDQPRGPAWVSDPMNSGFAVAATMPVSTTQEQYRGMLRNLLSERFHLVFHFEKQ